MRITSFSFPQPSLFHEIGGKAISTPRHFNEIPHSPSALHFPPALFWHFPGTFHPKKGVTLVSLNTIKKHPNPPPNRSGFFVTKINRNRAASLDWGPYFLHPKKRRSKKHALHFYALIPLIALMTQKWPIAVCYGGMGYMALWLHSSLTLAMPWEEKKN